MRQPVTSAARGVPTKLPRANQEGDRIGLFPISEYQEFSIATQLNRRRRKRRTGWRCRTDAIRYRPWKMALMIPINSPPCSQRCQMPRSMARSVCLRSAEIATITVAPVPEQNAAHCRNLPPKGILVARPRDQRTSMASGAGESTGNCSHSRQSRRDGRSTPDIR